MMDPLVMHIEIGCSPEHAFDIWTRRFSSWWPREHTVSGSANAEIVLEPMEGGRIYERTESGEVDWGEITRWEPPRRLSYLWHIRKDRKDATDVDIRFEDSGDGNTLLVIHHSGWERLGAEAETWRDANRGGWSGLLPHFVQACVAS